MTAPAVFGVPIWHPAKELYSGSVRELRLEIESHRARVNFFRRNYF